MGRERERQSDREWSYERIRLPFQGIKHAHCALDPLNFPSSSAAAAAVLFCCCVLHIKFTRLVAFIIEGFRVRCCCC